MAWDIDVKYKIHQHLANEIFFRIYKGTYPLGAKLLSYQKLSKEAGCSPETVRKACLILLSKGVVEKTRYGYFVTTNREKITEYRDNYLAAIEQEYITAKQKIDS